MLLRLPAFGARVGRAVAPRAPRFASSSGGGGRAAGANLTEAETAALTDALEARANARWDAYHAEHRAIPADDGVRRKRLIYRSKQRGWLEVDLLMGTWAVENVPALSAAELDEYEEILNCETIDIYNFITGKDPVPDRVDTPTMKRLQDYCATSPLGTRPDEYAAAKAESNLI